MKKSWKYKPKYILGALPAISLALLTACGGGGGGSSSSSPGVPVGGVVGSSGTSMCVGMGTWYGQVNITDVATYQQFLFDNGMCQGLQCGRSSPYAQLWITVGQNTGGTLPGPVTFALQPYLGGFQGSGQTLQADGYVNAAQNGMLVNYQMQNQNSYYAAYPGQPGYNPNDPANTGLQINTQFADASHATANAQLTYHLRPFASTTSVPLHGQINYNPQAGNASCVGYGAGYPGGYYPTNTIPYGNPGGYYYTRPYATQPAYGFRLQVW